MGKKKANIFEQYVDKIVLAVAGILSLALLWVFVLSNPQAVKYGSRKYGPGELDSVIKEEAERLKQTRLDAPPEPVPQPPDVSTPFNAIAQNPLDGINFELPYPGVGDKIVEEKRLYALPEIPPVTEPVASLIRTVAYIPTEEVTQSVTYAQVPIELGDLDFVTVQASIDTVTLYKNFDMSFANPRRVKTEWRDPRYAKPVFARVDLERSKQDDDGNWGDWEQVGPTRIDHLAKFLNVPEKVTELSLGTVDVTMQQFNQFTIYSHLLQPEPYDFASSREEETWLCPSLYATYVEKLEREETEKDREKREKERQDRERERDSRRPGGRSTVRNTGAGGAEDIYGGAFGGTDPRRSRTTNRRTDDRRGPGGRRDPGQGMYDEFGYEPYPGTMQPRTEAEKKAKDIINDMASVWIKQTDKLDELKEPLKFWAYDDSLTEGGVYQYRIRVGLFNPIAGHDWFMPAEQQFKDDVILWSAYSEPTAPVYVDKMIHFFPLATASSPETSVDVQVSRYHLGTWRSEKFNVHSGEPIGAVVEKEPERQLAAGMMMDQYEGYGPGFGSNASRGPQKIDFSTGAVMVDVVATTQWMGLGPALKEKMFSDFLYTFDGMGIEHFPVKSQYWSSEVKSKFDEIKNSENAEPINYKPRGSRSSTKKATVGGGRYDMMNQYDTMEGFPGRPIEGRRPR